MEKIVIFDWGGIVESHENNLQDLKNAKIRLIRKFNSPLSDKEILKGWTDKTQNGFRVDTINDEQEIRNWVNLVQKNTDINAPFEDFKKAYEEEFSRVKYYKEVAAYAHSLKNRCKIAILSNLMLFDKKRINDQYNLNKFDHVYLSFEIGMRKPDEAIYKYVLNDLNTSPKNILFIDDDVDNISTAQKCDWNVCQAYGYELDKIKQSVEDFLK